MDVLTEWSMQMSKMVLNLSRRLMMTLSLLLDFNDTFVLQEYKRL